MKIRRQSQLQDASYRTLIDKYNEMEEQYKQIEERPAQQECGNEPDEKQLKLIEDIKHVIDSSEEIYNQEFSLDDLSHMVGSNTTYVSKAINDIYGRNFRKLLNDKRIARATSKLADDSNEEIKIEKLALSLGYSSASSFITTFKSITGMTPAVYRRIVQES